MTPERLATLAQHIATAQSGAELAALRFFLREQDEWTSAVADLVQSKAIDMDWWPLPEYEVPR